MRAENDFLAARLDVPVTVSHSRVKVELRRHDESVTACAGAIDELMTDGAALVAHKKL